MSAIQEIETALARLAVRRRWHNAWRGFWLGLLGGALVWFLVFGIYKLAPLPRWGLVAAAIAGAVLALGGFLAGGWRRVTLLQTARWLDEKKQLKERLSTALEINAATGAGEWKELLIRDAAAHAQGIEPRALLPYVFPKATRWALLTVALGIGLGFVPEYRTQAFIKKQQDAENINQTGKQLADLIRQNMLQKPPALQKTEKSMEAVAELGEHLAKVPLTRGEAVRELASLQEKVGQQNKDLMQNPAIKQLERAAREPGGTGGSTQEELQNKIAELQKAMGKAAGAAPEKLDKLQRQLEKLQKQAGNMPAKDSPGAAAAKEQMSQALSELSQQARDLGASLPGLEEAIQALKSDKTDLFLRDLELAVKDLDKLKEMAKAMQQCQQQAAKLGKDLAEQLDKGQAQAAQATLQKMISQLKSGQLSKEQLQKLMEEVSKAVDPGSQYGKVGEHLKNAAQNLQQGQKQNAAQNLAEASKELEKLMQQMADSQSLREAMEALQRAQSCIAMGKNWDEMFGQCQNCGGRGCGMCMGRKLGWGHGGKPNAGVGTWADEEGGWSYFPEDGQRWDNSGIQRPDMDARGVSDRPTDLNPNLEATKVKGQFQPGGSMPSITLKGVSIRGQSAVQFEEAATAAQSEAQSALSQDKVPRAYQKAVHDYFDDLKK